MFDIGWSELLIIGVVALIVIGPKDLPEMFRTLGRFTAKLRSMSRDFQRAMEAAGKETGVTNIVRDVKDATSPKNLGLDAVRDAATRFEKWDPLKPAAKPPVTAVGPPAVPAPMGPATAALAEAKAQERAAALTAVKAPQTPAAAEPSVTPARKPRKDAAPKTEAVAQAEPAKQRKPRKPAEKGPDA